MRKQDALGDPRKVGFNALLIEVPSIKSLPTHVEKISLRTAKRLVRAHHYLHRAPPGHRFSLGVFVGPRLIGVLIFGRPVARLEDQGGTLELLRMVLFDSPKNSESRALGLAERWVRKNTSFRRFIAYADTERHEGTIYKAANWAVLGLRPLNRDGWTSRRGRIPDAGGRKMKFERRLRA